MTRPPASELDQPVRLPHTLSVADVADRVRSDPVRGLSEDEARDRLARIGPNALGRRPRPPYLGIALRQLADPLVALLVGAATVSALIGEEVEAVAIGVIVFLNTALGFGQEVGAERAILALRETVQRRASVVRSGREREVAVETLVPLHDPFGSVALDAPELAVVVALALVPFAAIEIAKGLLRRLAPAWAGSALRPPR